MADTIEDHGRQLASWKFLEYDEHQRGKTWYVFFFLIGGITVIYALLTFNFLFLFIVLIAWTMLFISTRRKPKKYQITVTEDGLEIGEKFHSYDDFQKFWIIYKPPQSKFLYLDFKTSWKPNLVIPLEQINPLKIREALLPYLEEDAAKEDEDLNETISREYKL